MKLTLFVLSCLIVVTWQQSPQYWSRYGPYAGRPFAPMPYYPAAHHYPADPYYSRYQYPSYLQHQFKQNDQQEDPATEFLANLVLAQHLIAANKEKQQDHAVDEEMKQEKGENAEDVQSRSFLFPKLFLKAQIFSTITSYTVTTSTLTSTSAISCIPAASFYAGSSQACRRKRDNAEIVSALDDENADGSLLHPSPVKSVEPTAVDYQRSERSVEVDSSLGKVEESGLRQGRLANPTTIGNFFGSTTTSTLTSFSIITSVTKRTVTLGSSLSCLPSGYSVC